MESNPTPSPSGCPAAAFEALAVVAESGPEKRLDRLIFSKGYQQREGSRTEARTATRGSILGVIKSGWSLDRIHFRFDKGISAKERLLEEWLHLARAECQ